MKNVFLLAVMALTSPLTLTYAKDCVVYQAPGKKTQYNQDGTRTTAQDLQQMMSSDCNLVVKPLSVAAQEAIIKGEAERKLAKLKRGEAAKTVYINPTLLK